MGLTIADLKKGERGVITDSSSKDSAQTIGDGLPAWQRSQAFTISPFL